MLFRTFEPYYNDEISSNICFICYEIENDIGDRTIQINSKEDYIKICICNLWVHNNCLNKWYENSNVCPICRSQVNKKFPLNIFLYLNNYYIILFTNFSRNYNNIIRFFLTLIFIFYTFQYYLLIFNYNYDNNDDKYKYSKYNKYDNDKYKYNNNNIKYYDEY